MLVQHKAIKLTYFMTKDVIIDKGVDYCGNLLPLEHVLMTYYWKTRVPRMVKMREIGRPKGEREIGSK